MTIKSKFLATPFIVSSITAPLLQSIQSSSLIQQNGSKKSQETTDQQVLTKDRHAASAHKQHTSKNEPTNRAAKQQQKNSPIRTNHNHQPKQSFGGLIDRVKGKLISRAKKSYKKIKDLFDNFSAKIGQKRTLASYQVNEYTSKDKKRYCLVIIMPTFTEEQTHVAFSQTPQGHCILKITAETNPLSEKSSDNHSTNVDLSEKLVALSPLNRESHSMYYHNGKLGLSICLPENVNPQTYSMTFENHTMKIEFERKDDTTSQHQTK